MKFVNNKCPKCDGNMEISNNQMICPFCGTSILFIKEAAIDDINESISLEEFQEQLNKDDKLYVIHSLDGISEFDVDVKIINDNLSQATLCLNKKDFVGAKKILDSIINETDYLNREMVFSIERLFFLCDMKVSNEMELFNKICYFEDNEYYLRALACADQESKDAYLTIAKHCTKRYNFINKKNEDIKDTIRLLDNNLNNDALKYAELMCEKYPTYSLSWANLCYINKYNNNDYSNCSNELTKIKECVDYREYLEIQEQEVNELKEYLNKKEFSFINIYKNAIGPFMLLCVLGSFLYGIILVIISMIDSINYKLIDLFIVFEIFGLISSIIVSIVNLIDLRNKTKHLINIKQKDTYLINIILNKHQYFDN